MPIGLQGMPVQFSFLFVHIIVSMRRVVESTAIGVAEKVWVFLMLVALTYMHQFILLLSKIISKNSKQLDNFMIWSNQPQSIF